MSPTAALHVSWEEDSTCASQGIEARKQKHPSDMHGRKAAPCTEIEIVPVADPRETKMAATLNVYASKRAKVVEERTCPAERATSITPMEDEGVLQ